MPGRCRIAPGPSLAHFFIPRGAACAPAPGRALLNFGPAAAGALPRAALHAHAPPDPVSSNLSARPPPAAALTAAAPTLPRPPTQVHPGRNVGLGKDYTLFALVEGIVTFERNSKLQKVSVVPFEDYTVPEGQQLKEGSRKMRRRAASLAALEAEVAAAMSAANLA